MGFIREGDMWVAAPSQEVTAVIIDPNPDQIRDFYLRRYTALFPQYTPADEVHFMQHGERPIMALYVDTRNNKDHLPPGMYKTAMTDFDSGLISLPTYTDNYIQLFKEHQSIVEDATAFFENRPKYQSLGITHRRGALLYGPPGNGKTRMAVEVAQAIIKNGYVAILHSNVAAHLLLSIGKALNNLPCVLIIEEIAANREMDSLLTFLEGEESWDNVYIIATTNYPEQLNANIVDRPGRFDLLIEFGQPNAWQREQYFNNFVQVSRSVIDKTEGFSISYLKYIVSEHIINGREITEIIAEINSRKATIKREFVAASRGLGFGDVFDD